MESSRGKQLQSIETVVVTGGSSGIGECFIHRLKRLKRDLCFCNISRRKPSLDSTDFPIHHIPCDLGQRDQVEAAAANVRDFLAGRSGGILLINNSGFGSYGPFPAPDLEQNLEMIDVNVRAVVHLTGLLLPLLKERGGAVINVASTAAFQATPYLATYGATKAFLLHWSLGLGEELRKEGVHVLALCPGPTATRFFERAGFDQPILSPHFGQTAEQVVDTALAAWERKKRLVVSGGLNKMLTRASSLLPRTAAARLSEMVLRKVRLEKS
jgi:uncharacterized protein